MEDSVGSGELVCMAGSLRSGGWVEHCKSTIVKKKKKIAGQFQITPGRVALLAVTKLCGTGILTILKSCTKIVVSKIPVIPPQETGEYQIKEEEETVELII